MKVPRPDPPRADASTPWEQAASVFAEALRRTRDWQEWEAARVALEANGEVARLLEQHRTLTIRWQQARSRGHALYGEDATRLAEVAAKLEHNAAFLRYRDASQRLLEGLRATNEALTSLLGIDLAASAACRAGGGCCG